MAQSALFLPRKETDATRKSYAGFESRFPTMPGKKKTQSIRRNALGSACHQYSWFNSDYKHPNDNGHKVIADIVTSHLMGGTWNDNSVVFKAFTTYTDRHPTLKEESTIHAIVKNGTVTIPSITFNCSEDLTGNFGLWTLTEVGDAGKGNYNILPQQVVAMPVFSADLTKILGTWFLNSNGIARVDIGSNVTKSFRLSDMSYPLTGKAAVISD